LFQVVLSSPLSPASCVVSSPHSPPASSFHHPPHEQLFARLVVASVSFVGGIHLLVCHSLLWVVMVCLTIVIITLCTSIPPYEQWLIVEGSGALKPLSSVCALCGQWLLGQGGGGVVSDVAWWEASGGTYHVGILLHRSPSIPPHAPDPSQQPHIPFGQGGGGLLGAISPSLPNTID
jgi:hypothetical protein